ncbi:Holliday junction resolvase [archaeon]|nr:Holliday junction resolvase [archaeon]
MSQKGANTERELFHMFWKNNWACMRAAGSGNTTMPAPDLIAGNKNNLLAIECKSTKKTSIYLKKQEIEQLTNFSNILNATSILAMRFNNNGWYFLNIEKLPKNKKGNYTITLKLCKEQGINFQELIGKYKQLKL